MSKLISQIKKSLKEFEGMKFFPYRCSAGKWSIGIGRNLSDNGIDYEECMILLQNDIERCIAELNSFSWFDDLSTPRKAVIIEMVFNLGLSRFLTFKRMIRAIKQKDYKKAAYEMMDSLWAHQVGERRSKTYAKRFINNDYKIYEQNS